MNPTPRVKGIRKIRLLLVAIALLVGSAFLIPPLIRSKQVAANIHCIGHLKCMGLAYRRWSTDHGDQVCFTVTTNSGGTLELCDRDSNGFDRNAFRYFIVMSNELSNPALLVCPSDRDKKPAKRFVDLGLDNITYQIRIGTNVNGWTPEEIAALCPIHNNVLLGDGSVQQRGKP